MKARIKGYDIEGTPQEIVDFIQKSCIDMDIPDANKVRIEQVGFTPRTSNALLCGGITYLYELENITAQQLEGMKGFGKKAMRELIEVLRKYQITNHDIEENRSRYYR